MTQNQTTIDPEDITRFEAVADSWWDMNGPMRPLHLFTPVRIDYILSALRRAGKHSVTDLTVLDIGCGGGLLAEPLARLGAQVTAIDASEGAIKAARHHSQQQGLNITYLTGASEILAAQPDYIGRFDLVYASEVIEHVADRHQFLTSIRTLMSDDGLFVLTTINRSLPALLSVKLAAEYVLKIIPKGTHEFDKFISPTTLSSECSDAGLLVDDVTGFVPRLAGGFRMSSVTQVNYGVSGQKC